MGWVVWSSDNCSLKGKWSGGDRTALSPHLFSGKALFSSRWAAEESMEQLVVPGGVHQPWCGAALWRWSTAALSSSSPWPPKAHVGTAQAGELPSRLVGASLSRAAAEMAHSACRIFPPPALLWFPPALTCISAALQPCPRVFLIPKNLKLPELPGTGNKRGHSLSNGGLSNPMKS